jgi:Rrf2 family protein
MLNITNQSDYGILFVSYLMGRKRYVPLSELIKETKLPQRFLARIAAQLVKNKIVESREGKIGGYRLSKKINKVTLYDYLKIFEGDLALAKCQAPDYDCPWDKVCHHKSFLRHQLSAVLSGELKKKRLIDLFSS